MTDDIPFFFKIRKIPYFYKEAFLGFGAFWYFVSTLLLSYKEMKYTRETLIYKFTHLEEALINNV